MEQLKEIYLQLIKDEQKSMLIIITITSDIINKERKRSITNHNNNIQITTNKNLSI